VVRARAVSPATTAYFVKPSGSLNGVAAEPLGRALRGGSAACLSAASFLFGRAHPTNGLARSPAGGIPDLATQLL
jgi:hypothetical protein